MRLKDVRDKLTAKQNALAEVFEQAKTDDGEFDFTKVTCLGADVKGSVAVAEKVREMNDELNELAGEAETLEAAEQAARDQEQRTKVLNRPPHPRPGAGNDAVDRAIKTIKSLGELVTADEAYIKWAKSGAGGGITFSFDELWPSDVLRKSMSFDTMGFKAEMTTTAGWAPESLRIPGLVVEAVTRPIQLLDIVPLGQTGFEQIVYMEETTRTHAAAEKAEGAAFAESTFVLTEKTSPVRKVTDSLPVTDEQLEDVAQAQSYINNRLTFGIRQRLDGQVLVGDAAGANLRGIKNVVGILT